MGFGNGKPRSSVRTTSSRVIPRRPPIENAPEEASHKTFDHRDPSSRRPTELSAHTTSVESSKPPA